MDELYGPEVPGGADCVMAVAASDRMGGSALARRRLLLGLGAVAGLGNVGELGAQMTQSEIAQWPSKPVRIVSPYPPGGSHDNVTRILAARFSEMWNQRVFVENRPGANNRIAAESVVRMPPDGYTLFHAATPLGSNPGLYGNKLPYDALRDFTPIARTMIGPVGFWVPAASPYRSLRELAEAARAQPNMLFVGSPGNGSGPHMVIELFMYRTGAKMEHLPMRGDAPLVIEVVAGRVDLAVTGMTVMKPHYAAGKVRLLAVSAEKRFPAAPQAPTLSEAGFPTVDGFAWFGLVAPAGLAPELVARINRDTNAVLALPEVRVPLETVGMIVATGSPEQFRGFIASEIEKWTALVKATGIQPD
jgi:tripartite-type tricarboxylate transporter receptor subunit TctC